MRMLAFIVCQLIATAAWARSLSPTDVEQRINQYGAAQAVRELDSNGDYDVILNQIQNGSGQWIGIAPQLALGADAGAAEDLGIALAFALPKNPEAVLSIIDVRDGPVLGVHRVCGVPFIEGSVSDVHPYITRSLTAVNRVRRPELARVKQMCLDALRG